MRVPTEFHDFLKCHANKDYLRFHVQMVFFAGSKTLAVRWGMLGAGCTCVVRTKECKKLLLIGSLDILTCEQRVDYTEQA